MGRWAAAAVLGITISMSRKARYATPSELLSRGCSPVRPGSPPCALSSQAEANAAEKARISTYNRDVECVATSNVMHCLRWILARTAQETRVFDATRDVTYIWTWIRSEWMEEGGGLSEMETAFPDDTLKIVFSKPGPTVVKPSTVRCRVFT